MVIYDKNKLIDFFSNYIKTSPEKHLFLMVLTFGLYDLYWMYKKNKIFQEIDSERLDPDREISIFLILPSLWFLIFYTIKMLVFWGNESVNIFTINWNTNLTEMSNLAIIFGLIEFIGWFMIFFLIMKYLFDFCMFFGNITQSYGVIWYIFMVSEFFALFFALFGNFYFVPFMFFTYITIPAMEANLNRIHDKYMIESEKLTFIKSGRMN